MGEWALSHKSFWTILCTFFSTESFCSKVIVIFELLSWWRRQSFGLSELTFNDWYSCEFCKMSPVFGSSLSSSLMGGFSFFSQLLLKINVIDRSPQSQIRRRQNSSFNLQVRVSKGLSRINGLASFQLHTLGPETDNDNSKRVKVIQDIDDWYLIWEAIVCWYQKIPFNKKYYYEYGTNGGRFNTTHWTLNIEHWTWQRKHFSNFNSLF